MTLKYLTATKKGGYVLHISTSDDAEELNAAIGAEMNRSGENRSAVVRRLIINSVTERIASERCQAALMVYDHAKDLAGEDGMSRAAMDMYKALVGWPMRPSIQFADEDSEVYKEWLSNSEGQPCAPGNPAQKSHAQIARGKMTPTVRYKIMERDEFQCLACGAKSKNGIKLVVDHIFPVSKGGQTVDANLQTLCEKCNMGKGSRIPKVVNGQA